MEKSAHQGKRCEKGLRVPPRESVKRLMKKKKQQKKKRKKKNRNGIEELVSAKGRGEEGGFLLQVTRGPYHGTWQAGSQTAPEADPSRGKVPALSVPTQRRNACCCLRSQRLK